MVREASKEEKESRRKDKEQERRRWPRNGSNQSLSRD